MLVFTSAIGISGLFSAFLSREREINDLRSKNAALETNVKICEDKLKYQSVMIELTKNVELLRQMSNNLKHRSK